MIIVCTSCGARYKFDETKLGGRPKAKTKCGKCGSSIEIENPRLGAMTLPPGAFSPVAATAGPTDTRPAEPVPGTDPKLRATHPSMGAAPEIGGNTITGRDLHKMGVVDLPKDKRYSLAVLQGPATGQIFPLTKVRTTIGRAGADINIDDPEASRSHAALEIMGDHSILRDLGSTNGTFVDIDKIDNHMLNNQMEFRIGSHVLMFIVTDVE